MKLTNTAGLLVLLPRSALKLNNPRRNSVPVSEVVRCNEESVERVDVVDGWVGGGGC